MKLTEAAKKLPEEVAKLIEQERYRKEIKAIFQRGSITKGTQHYVDTIGTLELAELSLCGVLSSAFDKHLKTFTYEISSGLEELSDQDVSLGLSDMVIYSQADDDLTKILDQYIGEKTIINGAEGVLMSEKGKVYHVTFFIDQTPNVETCGVTPTEMIRKAEMPLQDLKRDEQNLTIGATTGGYTCNGIDDKAYEPLYKLLTSKGVTAVHGNLLHELV